MKDSRKVLIIIGMILLVVFAVVLALKALFAAFDLGAGAR